ncbi:MAG: amidohydrolase [Acidobacteriota bacterium]
MRTHRRSYVLPTRKTSVRFLCHLGCYLNALPRVVEAALVSLIVIGAGACGGNLRIESADLVLRNGRIVTMDETLPQAEAIAVKGDIIAAVGSNDEIGRYVGASTRVIDLAGQLTIPGFIESHGHFTGIGRGKIALDLSHARSWEQVVSIVAEAARHEAPGEWILGLRWHQEKWDVRPQPNVEGFPVHHALSKVSPDNPVVLMHASGHAAMANAKALEMGGITRRTPNPPGGEILKDAGGNPTGMLREAAGGLVLRARGKALARRSAEQVEADARRELDLAIKEVVSKGITSFQDAGSSFQTVDRLKRYADEGRLLVRLWVMLNENNEALRAHIADYEGPNYVTKFLTVRGIKRSLDGALGARGAWLIEPYSDLPGSTGLNTTPVATIEETARIALQHGFQLCVHAIGDRANREMLDLFERVFKANPSRRDLRWRIEHAQHLRVDDIPRFGRLGVIASMQGIHATSDAPFVVSRLGRERARQGAYAWRSLLDSKAIIANGSDAPVENVDPIASFYASVTRKLPDGSTFYPEQRMTREEALRSYTLHAAYAVFEEEIKGSLTVGKLADMTVLSKNVLVVPESDILGTRVVYTIVGGRVVHEQAGLTEK